ncbi:alpha/beta hydrolase [Variovorax boronicumulans]|uniref:alpha/beta hydrolase n=1 Tax=Variovorax boronicumulans TaxID=436515 RepID=UPI001C55EDB7
MTTLCMVDPAARQLALTFAAFDPSQQPIAEYRANLASLFPALAPTFEERVIPGAPGSAPVRVLIHRPRQVGSERLPAILFLHASGFISGTPDMFSAANDAMAQQHRALVVSVQYRLAPESPFPAALQDAHAALVWLFAQADALGVDPARIIVMGESAGGGLAAMLTLLARDRGEHAVAGQVLVYPMLDPRTGTDDAPVHNPSTGEFLWTVRHNRFAWAALRGDAAIDARWLPYLVPALAPDLHALPPTFIAVGALDLFLEEDVAYALRLSRAGVRVEAHVYPGGIHGFDFVPCEVSAQYRADLAAALTWMLAGAPAA